MTLHRVKLCGCGHEEEAHELLEDGSRGPCRFCRNTGLHGLTPCPRFHSRRNGAGRAPTAPGPFEVFEARVREAVDELRAAVGLAQIDPAPRHLARQVPEILQHDPGQVSPKLARYSSTNGHRPLSRCERALLQVLAQRRGLETSKAQLAVLSGYSSRSSGFQNALGALRSRGLVDGLQITNGGVAVAPTDPMPTGPALFEHWSSRLHKCERTLLGQLRARGGVLSRSQLAAWSGYSEASSGFQNALGRLRTLELVDGNREALRLSPDLRLL
jgi:hypothetical protein